MDASFVTPAMFWWTAGLVIGFPAAVVALGEAVMRLRRAGRPVAATLANIRSLVLPPLAVSILAVRVVGLPRTHTAVQIDQTILWIAIIYTALKFVIDVVFANPAEGSWQSHVPRLFLDLTRFLLVLIGGVIVLSAIWGLNLESFVAALGVGSLVFGLALQEPLGNVFAGVMLMFERPFGLGDWIKVDATTGRVVEINWRAVHLETSGRELLILPNSTLAKGTVTNFTKSGRIHTETILLGFSYDDPPNKVKKALVETALATEGVMADPPPKVATEAYLDSQISYKVSFSVGSYLLLKSVRDDFMTRVWYVARRNGLTMPYPVQTQIQVARAEVDAEGRRDPAQLIAEFPQFGVRDPEALAEVAADVVVMEFGRGEIVVAAGERAAGLYVVVSGAAVLSIEADDGSTAEVARAERGEFFGEASVLSGEPSEVAVSAVDDLVVMVFDSKTLQLVLDRTPRLARDIGRVMDVRRKAAHAATASL